jgi:hypothetical protein
MAFSAGHTSCDADNTRAWKKLTKWVPGRWDNEMLDHRRLLHWWGLPAAVAVVLHVTGGPWYGWAAVCGWASHLGGDFVFGQAGFGTPKGIPLAPWWWHVGVGLKSGGRVERVVTPAVACTAVWWTTGWAGAAQVIALAR